MSIYKALHTTENETIDGGEWKILIVFAVTIFLVTRVFYINA